jgi:hypothetical protein
MLLLPSFEVAFYTRYPRLYTMWLYQMGLNEQLALQHTHIAHVLVYQVMKKEITSKVIF